MLAHSGMQRAALWLCQRLSTLLRVRAPARGAAASASPPAEHAATWGTCAGARIHGQAACRGRQGRPLLLSVRAAEGLQHVHAVLAPAVRPCQPPWPPRQHVLSGMLSCHAGVAPSPAALPHIASVTPAALRARRWCAAATA
jgi:hypothetical protein